MYEISIFADAVIFNTIEFWTGNNPIAQIDETVEGETGTYAIKSNDTGYTITNLNTGVVTVLSYDNNNSTWSVSANGNTIEFLTFVDETHIKIYGLDNAIELSEDGVLAYKQQLQEMYPNLAITY